MKLVLEALLDAQSDPAMGSERLTQTQLLTRIKKLPIEEITVLHYSKISRTLKRLKEYGLVRSDKENKGAQYFITKKGISILKRKGKHGKKNKNSINLSFENNDASLRTPGGIYIEDEEIDWEALTSVETLKPIPLDSLKYIQCPVCGKWKSSDGFIDALYRIYEIRPALYKQVVEVLKEEGIVFDVKNEV